MAPIPETRRWFEEALRKTGEAFSKGRRYRLLNASMPNVSSSARAVSFYAWANAEEPPRSLGGSPQGTREEAIGWAVRDAGLA